jgi:hypothetical protein
MTADLVDVCDRYTDRVMEQYFLVGCNELK